MSDNYQSEIGGKGAAVLAELKQQGVQRVEILFDGGGDEGQITDVEAFDSQGQQINLAPLRSPVNPASSLRDDLEEIAYDALNGTGVNWYNDLGGEGTITIDAAAGTLHAEIHQRVEEYETTEWDWKL